MKRIAICLLPCVLLGACLTAPKECPVNPSNPATETFAPSLGVDLNNMERTSLGDYRQDVVVGTGAQLDSLQVVQIHYSAYLSDGTLVDQRTDANYLIDLSAFATAVGLADGMLGMNVGGQRIIVAPSELALGACSQGTPLGTIPGNSTLIYKVELLAIGS